MVGNVDKISNSINNINSDIRAEVVLSEVIDNLSIREGYFVNHKGQFRRSYRKDILDSKVKDFENVTTQFLELNISRDGFYDSLPEAIFHAPEIYENKRNVNQMVSYFKQHKSEEDYARLFFLPFENEFFDQKIKLSKLEKKLLLDFDGTKPVKFIYDFWNLQKDNIPEVLLAKLIRLFPYAYKIAGDLDLTSHCLEYLLEEKVNIKISRFKEIKDLEEETLLGESKLGIDTISGNEYTDYSVFVDFQIGPLENTTIRQYIHDGELKKFVELFYEFFLPMEIEAKTTIILKDSLQEFILKKQPESILGITTRI